MSQKIALMFHVSTESIYLGHPVFDFKTLVQHSQSGARSEDKCQQFIKRQNSVQANAFDLDNEFNLIYLWGW